MPIAGIGEACEERYGYNLRQTLNEIRQQALSYLDEELSWIYYMKEKLRLDNKGQ
ncbi:hypothetical protein MASR2M70_11930 [Bacillota bacterium]